MVFVPVWFVCVCVCVCVCARARACMRACVRARVFIVFKMFTFALYFFLPVSE